ncbi:MAG: trypsin-like peptidase domain-containing protein [Nocardioidaceae bacterium]|nr:trypsin-like peptidase domain-containing protein [Nocardioidaceae bacterium]
MNDEHQPEGQADDTPTEDDLGPEDRPAPQWSPPPPGSSVPTPPDQAPSEAPAGQPEPTAILPAGALAPSLMPPQAPPPPPAGPPSGAPGGGLARATGPASGPESGPESGPRRPRALWPLVALLALVVGLGGGLLGALSYDKLVDGDDTASGPGYADTGLADADLRDEAPLKSPGSVAAVASAVLPSTVQILADYNGQSGGATGSGWVMDKNGHIITNNHVVADAAEDKGKIVVIDHDRNRYDATVVGRSKVYDLAVLYVEDGKKLPPAKLGYSAKLQVGEPLVALGSPLNLPDTVTSGIVSYLHRPVTTGKDPDELSYIDAIQTDAAINPGNSGGPLVNMKGEVVGVNSAIATAGGGSVDSEAGNIGVGFAIPVEQVRITADQILKTGKAQRPIIGAMVQTGGMPTGNGAEIKGVTDDSPAEKAGLKQGDRITHVNGTRVADGLALIVNLSTHQPGQTVELTVQRGSKEMKVKVTLGGEDG